MAFKNLYALLGVNPNATDTEIVKAMREVAQLQLVELSDLRQCKAVLLNPEARKKYNAQLYAEYPEILQSMIDANANSSNKRPSNSKDESDSVNSADGLHELRLKKPLLALNSKAIPIYNENTGEAKLTFVGQSIMPFLIGIFTPLLIGDVVGFLMCLGLYLVLMVLMYSIGGGFFVFLTALMFCAVLCLQYCNFYTLRQIKKGFKLCGTNKQNRVAAQCLKIKMTNKNTISNCPEIVIEKKTGIDVLFTVIIWMFIIFVLLIQLALIINS